jgi:hypothetical protein
VPVGSCTQRARFAHAPRALVTAREMRHACRNSAPLNRAVLSHKGLQCSPRIMREETESCRGRSAQP